MKDYKLLLVSLLLLLIPFLQVDAEEYLLNYSSHIQSYGWISQVSDGDISGTIGQGKRLEAFNIEKNETILTGDIYYRSYVEGIGWQNYVSTGNISGTVGQSKKIEMIQIKLTDELLEQYDIYYRVHVAKIGWLDWASNDKITGTIGYNYQIEALQIKLIKKGEEVPQNTSDIYRESKVNTKYSSHIQSYGWTSQVSDGDISGTTGQSKRLEAFNIEKNETILTGDIYYRSYVENLGWQDYVSTGNISGTVGQSKKIEMIQIKLTDELLEQYDIYYRVHVAKIGWLDWASNDKITGTIGYNYQIEALQIKLIKKGEEVPQNTSDICRINDISVKYQSYVNNNWQDIKKDGETSGTVGEAKPIKALKIILNDGLVNSWISYRSYSNNKWSEYVSGGEIIGSKNNDKIEMIQIKLSEEASQYYDIYYRVHVAKIGWLDWASNDKIAGSLGYGYQIEAIEIKIVDKGDVAPGSVDTPYQEKKDYLTYSTHMQSYGWLDSVYDNEINGLAGAGKRLEAIRININNASVEGSIKYSAHVQSIGWQSYVSDGEMAGTVGEYKRIEAIKIELTGELANLYDVYYKAYVEDFGWLDWAKNGEIAGSISLYKRMEAIKIILVEKNGNAPGSTEQSYVDSMFRIIDGKSYYYSNGNVTTGFKTILGVKYFFNSSGVLIASNVKKIIDVSSYQKSIDWSSVKNDGVDGAIIRLGYGTSYTTDACVEDGYFATNYNGTKNNGLLSGIYLYSYAIDGTSARLEGEFVLDRLRHYNVSKDIVIYYDLEGNNWTNNLTQNDYDTIVTTFSELLLKSGYTVKVYSYKYWAENKLSELVKSKLDWIAHYSDYCTYNGSYRGWQYTDSGTVAGISGKVDVSVWLR